MPSVVSGGTLGYCVNFEYYERERMGNLRRVTGQCAQFLQLLRGYSRFTSTGHQPLSWVVAANVAIELVTMGVSRRNRSAGETAEQLSVTAEVSNWLEVLHAQLAGPPPRPNTR